MDNTACELSELTEIEQKKTYTHFARPILDNLFKALQSKKLSKDACLIWIMLKGEGTFHPELSVTKSIRSIANQLGISISTSQKSLLELERGGYLVIERVKNSLKHIPSTLKVRFPKSGIELAKLDKDRSTASEKDNNLSTEVYQNSVHRRSREKNDLMKDQITKNINNTDTQTCAQTNPTKINDNAVDDCCTSSPNEKPIYDDPLDEIVIKKQSVIQKLTVKKIHLEQQYQQNLGDIETYGKLTMVKQELENQAQELEQLKIKPKPAKSDVQKTIESKARGGRRQEKLELGEKMESYLDRRLRELHEQRLISNLDEQKAWAKYQLENFEIGSSLIHGVNAIVSMIKRNCFKCPGGFVAT